MSEVKPTGFNDLKPAELYRSAIEDFALPVEEADKGKKKVLLAAFLEGGVEWADYVAQHPEVAPVEPVVPEAPANVVTSKDVKAQVEDEEIVIRVAEAPKPNVREKFLIKMVRDNPRFDLKGGISFTQEHPYALVDEAMADYLLTREDGFRQATPGELREFYG